VYGLLSEGDILQIAGDFVGAAQSYKGACQAVQGMNWHTGRDS